MNKWGTVKIPLDKDEYGLDRDGWVEIKKRLSGRDLYSMAKDGVGADAVQLTEKLVEAAVVAWDIAVDGEPVPFEPSQAADLPAGIYNAIVVEVSQRNPFPSSRRPTAAPM